MYTNADLKISSYVYSLKKQNTQHFKLLILRILKLFAREVCKFLKK